MLLNATQSANSSGVLEALQAGANPNVRDPKGRTPLHFMAGVGLAPAVVLLVHYGAQLDAQDADGLTPLHMAAGYANARTLRVLVAAGADIELTGESQGTPFEVVKSLGEYEWSQVYASGKKMGKKKDEKLQKLKQCVDILLDPEQVRRAHARAREASPRSAPRRMPNRAVGGGMRTEVRPPIDGAIGPTCERCARAGAQGQHLGRPARGDAARHLDLARVPRGGRGRGRGSMEQ
eukprot:6068118-Prymnesium_polylepis.1